METTYAQPELTWKQIGRELLDIGTQIARQYGLMPKNPGFRTLPANSPLTIDGTLYSVRKSQESGEQDLTALSQDVPYEGQWFYTPTDSTWHSIGTEHAEVFLPNGHFTLSSSMAIEKLSIEGREVFHYHTHPRIAGEHMVNTLYAMLKPEEQGHSAKAFASALLYAHLCFPSPENQDGGGDMGVYCNFKRENMEVKFKARIASPIGITDVEILDPSQETVNLYSELHKDIFTRIAKECVSFDEKDSNIDIRLEEFFDTINKEMQGKIKLTFLPSKSQVECL